MNQLRSVGIQLVMFVALMLCVSATARAEHSATAASNVGQWVDTAGLTGAWGYGDYSEDTGDITGNVTFTGGLFGTTTTVPAMNYDNGTSVTAVNCVSESSSQSTYSADCFCWLSNDTDATIETTSPMLAIASLTAVSQQNGTAHNSCGMGGLTIDADSTLTLPADPAEADDDNASYFSPSAEAGNGTLTMNPDDFNQWTGQVSGHATSSDD